MDRHGVLRNMILGRTSSGAIQIKTDSPKGLRAVECTCCVPVDPGFNPCKDCVSVIEDWTFSLSGNLVRNYSGQNQFDANICPGTNCNLQDFPSNLSPRTCSDSWTAYLYYNPETGEYAEYAISLNRSSLNNTPATCGWTVRLQLFGSLYISEIGDMCSFGYDDSVFTSDLNPAGSYNFQVFAPCLPPCDPLMPPGFPCGDPTALGTHTVTIS